MGRATIAVLGFLLFVSCSQAQTVTDGSDAVTGPENVRILLEMIARQLHSSDAKVTNLRKGRKDALCGSVEVKNRMGIDTGPRGFVADLAERFFGRLPEGPELRSPASMADYKAMERARTLFAANCMDP